jgi:hypothetical protein
MLFTFTPSTQINIILKTKTMQDTKVSDKKSYSWELLEKGLDDLLKEKFSDKELAAIGKSAKVSTLTCRRYILDKRVDRFETGQNILAAARKFIVEREHSVKKLVS